jgi:hypothetical protein
MSEELTVSSGVPGSGSGSFMKNLGMYAHIAEISLIAGSAIYFYSRNAKLEARIAELEKKLSDRSAAATQSPEDKQKELNDMASFIYRKLREELHQELREELHQELREELRGAEGGKKKKKVRVEDHRHHDTGSGTGDSLEEIQVSTSTDIDDDIENELKKEM